MNEDEYSPGDFEEGWKKDYFSDSTGDEMKRSLQNNWAVELLVADYEQASEDGRMRDGLLHNSYYVGLVLFGLILNASLNLADAGRFALLATVTLIGSVLYFLLFAWSLSSKAGRDASWDRRSEIEDMVKVVNPHLMRSNDSCFKRLNRLDDGKYEAQGYSGIDSISVGRLIVYANVVIGGGLLAVALWAASMMA